MEPYVECMRSVEGEKNETVLMEALLKKYENIYKLYPCYVALEKVDLKKLQRLTAAKSVSSGRRSRHYVCYVCLVKFNNNTDLQAHKVLHDDEENLEEAMKPVKETSLDILSHIKSDLSSSDPSVQKEEQEACGEAEESYVFKCLTCACYFRTGLNLFVHIRENKGKACKFYCDHCKKVFKYPVEFSQHITHHLENIKRKKKENRPINSVTAAQPANRYNCTQPVGKYNCALCTKTFEDCFQRKRHLYFGHKMNESDIDKLLCDYNKLRDSNINNSREAIKDCDNEISNAERLSESKLPSSDSEIKNVKIPSGGDLPNYDSGSNPKQIESINKTNVLDEKTGLFGGEMAEKVFTCNMCFDEFSNKKDLESHITLHIELNTVDENPCGRDPQSSNSKTSEADKIDDVIIIDDDDENGETSHKQNISLQEKLKRKNPQMRLQGVKFYPAKGNSLLKSNVIGNKGGPSFIYNKATGLQLLQKIPPMQQQPTQMLLLSGFNPTQTVASQDANNMQLLKTGPTSFRLCYDANKVNQVNRSDSHTSSSSQSNMNRQNEQPKTNFIPISQIPVINFRNVTSAVPASTMPPPLVAPTILPLKMSNTSSVTPVISSVTTVQNRPSPKETSINVNPSLVSEVPTSSHITATSNEELPSESRKKNTSNTTQQTILSENSNYTTPVILTTTGNMNCQNTPSSTGSSLKPSAIKNTEENNENNIHDQNDVRSNTKHTADTDNESDLDNLVIDEGENVEARDERLALSIDSGDIPKNTVNDDGNQDRITNVDKSLVDVSDKPKIFVRKLSDLMDPKILGITEDKKNKQEKKEKQEKKCDDCNQVFLRVRSLRLHVRKKHKCTVCEFENCRIHVMKHHYQNVHNTYLCTRCKAIFANGYDLYKHHSENHICPDCKHPMTTFEIHKPKCTRKPIEKMSK